MVEIDPYVFRWVWRLHISPTLYMPSILEACRLLGEPGLAVEIAKRMGSNHPYARVKLGVLMGEMEYYYRKDALTGRLDYFVEHRDWNVYDVPEWYESVDALWRDRLNEAHSVRADEVVGNLLVPLVLDDTVYGIVFNDKAQSSWDAAHQRMELVCKWAHFPIRRIGFYRVQSNIIEEFPVTEHIEKTPAPLSALGVTNLWPW